MIQGRSSSLPARRKRYYFPVNIQNAAEFARRSAATYDGWDTTYWYLAAAYGHLGWADEANKAIAKILSLSPGTTVSRIRNLPIQDESATCDLARWLAKGWTARVKLLSGRLSARGPADMGVQTIKIT